MSNPEERACTRKVGPDCKYLTAALSWWCDNDACCRARGTKFPGIVSCPYYRPVPVPAWNDFWFGLSTTVVGVTMTFIFLTILFSLGTLL